MENGGYLFAAFVIVWAVLFVYVLILVNKQKVLQKEIESLKDRLKEKESQK